MENMDGTQAAHDIGVHLAEATAAAAVAAARWAGRGDKCGADAAAVDAMRQVLGRLPIVARIVVGEGEKDGAPMIAAGEQIGSGGFDLDLAVDPVEGTNFVADGVPRALSVLGATQRGSMFDPGPSYYMQKLVVGPPCAGLVDLDAPAADTVGVIAKANGIPVAEVRVAILDRPRNADVIAGVRGAGAGVWLLDDGDVGPVLMACLPESGLHAVAGIGGTPEGVASACAVAALGGDLIGRMVPQGAEEAERVAQRFERPSAVLELTDLVQGPTWFATTGITGDDVFPGVTADEVTTLVVSPGTHRWVTVAIADAVLS